MEQVLKGQTSSRNFQEIQNYVKHLGMEAEFFYEKWTNARDMCSILMKDYNNIVEAAKMRAIDVRARSPPDNISSPFTRLFGSAISSSTPS